MKTHHQQVLLNFKKAKSHVDKLLGMTTEGKYCIDIMQQNLAVIGLLRSAHQMLMEDHLHSCFSTAMKSGSPRKKSEMIEEILKVSKIAAK